MALGKGIPVINGFDLNSKLPLDSRAVADTMEDMNALVTNGSVGDGQLCYCKADKKLYMLKDNVWGEVGCGGGGKSVPPTLWLFSFDSEGNPSIKTTITQEEKDNLDNGLYNQVMYYPNEDGIFNTYTPSKLFNESGGNVFTQFNVILDSGSAAVKNASLYGLTIGEKDTSGNYPITIKKQIDIDVGSGGTITSPTLDLVEKTSNGVFKPRTSITSNEYENLKNNLYNQVNYTDAIESSKDFPMALPTKIYKIDDNNYYFTEFSADGTGLSSLVLYKLAINNNNNNNITITKTFDFNIGSFNNSYLVLEYGYIETGGFPKDDTTSVSASFRVAIDLLEYLSMETIIVYDNGEENPVMFNVAKDSLRHKYNSVCFSNDNSIYFYYLTEFELTSVSDNKYSVAFKVRRKTIPAPTTTITFEN